jgi:hypothetical protein
MDWKLATHVSHPELLLSADGPHVSSHEDTEKETETPASSDRTPLESHHHSSDLLQTCTSIISAFRKQAEHVKCVEAVIHDGLAEMTRRGVQGEEVKGEEVSIPPDKQSVQKGNHRQGKRKDSVRNPELQNPRCRWSERSLRGSTAGAPRKRK